MGSTTSEAKRRERVGGGRFRPLLIILLLIALLLVWIGVSQEQPQIIQRNAHFLCLDCLGIG